MKSSVVQFGCTFILTIQSAMTGFMAVWPSYAIGMLKSDESPLGFNITQNDGNLIGSIPMLGSLISTLVAGVLAEVLGRKKTIILSAVAYVLSWSLIATSGSVVQVILGRFICGLSAGLSVVLVYITMSEITHLSLRGSVSCVPFLLFNLGIIASYILGWFCSYDLICYISLTVAVINVILISCLKETPTYLLKIGKEKEALKSLKFYRGKSNTTDAILEELSYIKSQRNQPLNDSSEAEKLTQTEKETLQNEMLRIDENSGIKNPWILLFTVPHNRRALVNSVMFITLAIGMGMVAVQTYASQFFATAAPTLSPDVCSVLLGTVMLLTSLLTVAVTDLFPRRTIMILTCTVATICLAILGTLMRWSWAPAWVAPIVIMVYCIMYQLGVINIIFVQLSESFGPQVNSPATAIIFSVMFAANFLVLFLFGPAVDYFGIDGTFYLFAIIGAITTLMAILCMKETRRVPLEDIQKMHANGFLYKRLFVSEK